MKKAIAVLAIIGFVVGFLVMLFAISVIEDPAIKVAIAGYLLFTFCGTALKMLNGKLD